MQQPALKTTYTLAEEHLTGPGAAIGTAAYMSPEQARGEELDTGTDLFSFGAVLYEMATGQRAFQGGTTALILDGILNRQPVSTVQLRPDLPPKLEEIINKALDKDPDLRYQHASDMGTDLKRLNRATSSATSEPPSSSGEPHRGPASDAGIIAGAIKRHKKAASVESLLGYDDKAGSFLDPPEDPELAQSVAEGETLAHYRILEKLGQGGMGVVYKARDTHLNRLVAIKMLPRRLMALPERRARFAQEARAASSLNHPNIVTIYDIGEAEGRHFISMEYVEGSTLAENR